MKKKKQNKNQGAEKIDTTILARPSHPNQSKTYGALAIILLITIFVYLPVLHNGLLNWDDDGYILKNQLIRSIHLNDIFTQYVKSNYHPLTMLTLALEYHFFGLNEKGYHAFNLALHLLNVLLVFYTLFLLTNKTGIALVAALLFGIHPLHVESVAWAAELKDLLYTFFFLASYIFYIKYLKNPKNTFYVFALLLFLAALLSKAMAASLPVLFLLTDYFMGRKITSKTLLEKLPFFSLAIVFGVIAVIAQKSTGATDMIVFPFFQRILFASSGFIMYLAKLAVALQLSAYYPYPIHPGTDIPVLYYLFPVLLIGLAVLVFYSLRFNKTILFGIGFFAITVFLVLQLLPVGGAIMADRYSYIPSIGIFYLAGIGLDFLWNKNLKWAAGIIFFAFAIFFAAKTNARCKIWKDELTLWNDVINQYQTVSLAYHNRAAVFYGEKKYDLALNDYNKAVELNPKDHETFNNRGLVFLNTNKDNEALKDFNKSIELNPYYSQAYLNRGIVFMNGNQNDEALKDFSKSIELKPDYERPYNNRGCIYYNDKKYDVAINDYSKAITLKPDYAEAYYNRGLAENKLGQKDKACQDFNKAASMRYQKAVNELSALCK